MNDFEFYFTSTVEFPRSFSLGPFRVWDSAVRQLIAINCDQQHDNKLINKLFWTQQ